MSYHAGEDERVQAGHAICAFTLFLHMVLLPLASVGASSNQRCVAQHRANGCWQTCQYSWHKTSPFLGMRDSVFYWIEEGSQPKLLNSNYTCASDS